MKACPTSAPITRSSSQYDRDAASSRNSFSMSQRHVVVAETCASGAGVSGEGKKDLFEAAGDEMRLRAKFLQGSLADNFAAAQEHESVANASCVSKLMDREKKRSTTGCRLLQDGHHVARLTEIESIEGLVEHEQRLRSQQSDCKQNSPVFA